METRPVRRMNPDEVIKALDCCVKQAKDIGDCITTSCPYYENSARIGCWVDMNEDAYKLLKHYRDGWNELRSTITEMRDNNGTGSQQDVCRFLVSLMNIIEEKWIWENNVW